MSGDTIQHWEGEGDGLPPERQWGRFVAGGMVGALLALLLVGLHVWFFHRTLLAAGASHMVTSGLEPIVSVEDLEIIEGEFDRAADWYVDGRLELPLLVRAMQVVMAADLVAHAAVRTVRESLAGWPGIEPREADTIARRVGAAIVARRLSPEQLADALGSAGRRSGPGEPLAEGPAWGTGFLLYGDRIQLATRPGEAEARTAIDALADLLDALIEDTPPLPGDLRSHLRERIDGEVGWALEP